MSATYQDLLAGLAQVVGIDPTQFGATEELVVDGLSVGFTCNGDAETGSVACFVTLGVINDAQRAQIATTLLEANYLWAGTRGATLALQPDTDNVALCAYWPIPFLTASRLAEALNQLLESATFWWRFINGTMASGAQSFDERRRFIDVA